MPRRNYLSQLSNNRSTCQRWLEVCAMFLERAECSLAVGKSAPEFSALSLAEAKSAREVCAMSLAEGENTPEVSAMSLAVGKSARKVSASSLAEGKSLIFRSSPAKPAPDKPAAKFLCTDSSPPQNPGPVNR